MLVNFVLKKLVEVEKDYMLEPEKITIEKKNDKDEFEKIEIERYKALSSRFL